MSKLMALLISTSLLRVASVSLAMPHEAGNSTVDKTEPQIETRVYLRKQCLLSEKSDLSKQQPKAAAIPALAAIFIPLLIEKAIGGIAAALKRAGGEETLKDSGRLPTYLYRLKREKDKNVLSLNPDLKCVIVVRGTFSKPDDTAPEITFGVSDKVFLEPAEEGRRIKRLVDNGIPVVEIAAFYEAEIKLSDDTTALRYESRFLEVNRFQGSGSPDKRVMIVSISIAGAGEKENEPTLSLVLVNQGELRKGTILGPEKLSSQRTSWVGGLAISEASLKALRTIEFPNQEHPDTLGIMPVTVEGVFAETDRGSKALLFIAEVLDSTRQDVSKAISADFLKDSNKQAAEAADALEKLRVLEEEAYYAYLEAKAKLADVGPVPDHPTEAQTAERNLRKFETERTQRIWCGKYKALTTVGIKTSGPRQNGC